MRANDQEHLMGDGTWHEDYIVEDMSGLPVEVSVSKANGTESVYVHYRRTDGKELPLVFDNGNGKVTVRFSRHLCNGVMDGSYVMGSIRKGNRNEVLYRLGFIDLTIEPVYEKCVPLTSVRKSRVSSLPVAPLTLEELYRLPEGTDISEMQGMYVRGTENSIIAGTYIGRRKIGVNRVYGKEIKI